MPFGSLLILDDDPIVGQIIQLSAQACGFEARHFTDPADFLAALSLGGATHVAIDLTLPGTSGVQILREVAALGSAGRVIICSGCGDDELQAALAEARRLGLACAGLLPKPFTLQTLKTLLGVGG